MSKREQFVMGELVSPPRAVAASGDYKGTFLQDCTLAPSALSAGPSVGEQTFTVKGLKTTDRIIYCAYQGAQTAAVAVTSARVSAANTLALTFVATAGTPTPASGVYTIGVVRGA
jgi:hypothetical protein